MALNTRTVTRPNLAYAMGLIPGHSVQHVFGENAAVGTTFEDIWFNGGLYPWPITAETIRIASGGNAADDAGGAGARTVKVVVLDTNWDVQTITLACAGVAASAPSTITVRRVLRAWVDDCGAYTSANTGAIVIENTGSAQTLAHIAAGLGSTQLSMYTVPAGHTAFMVRFHVDVDSNKNGEVRLYSRPSADIVAAPFKALRLRHRDTGITGEHLQVFEAPLSFAEKTDIWAAAKVDSTTGGVEVAYDLVLKKNNV